MGIDRAGAAVYIERECVLGTFFFLSDGFLHRSLGENHGDLVEGPRKPTYRALDTYHSHQLLSLI
jgi:hypothetical protein